MPTEAPIPPMRENPFENLKLLTNEQKDDILARVIGGLYLEYEGYWNPEKDVSGADYIDHVTMALSKYNLIPSDEQTMIFEVVGLVGPDDKPAYVKVKSSEIEEWPVLEEDLRKALDGDPLVRGIHVSHVSDGDGGQDFGLDVSEVKVYLEMDYRGHGIIVLKRVYDDGSGEDA